MSDTPRTDECAWTPKDSIVEVVGSDFARQLERENNDLRKLLEADKAFLRSKCFSTLIELIEDKKRLDWLESFESCRDPHVTIPWRNGLGGDAYSGKAIRSAIDAARKATP